MNVVDTAQWVMPGQHLEMDDYKYLIMLGESPWGLACHQLKGTELLHRDQVKWRHQEGKRPGWPAWSRRRCVPCCTSGSSCCRRAGA